jgi:hypothetical protein
LDRRKVWFKRLSTGVVTLAVGGLAGFLVPAVSIDISPKAPTILSPDAVSPVAREFFVAYVHDDQAALDRLQARAETKAKAARFKAEYATVDQPIHLGSWVVGGGVTLHAYASRVVDASGTESQLAWRVLTVAGSVGIIDPPPSVTTP